MKSFLRTLFIVCTLLNVFKLAHAESGGGGVAGNGETIVKNSDGHYEIGDPYYVESTPPKFEVEPEVFKIDQHPQINAYYQSAVRILQHRSALITASGPSEYKIRLVEKPACNDSYLTTKGSGTQVACVWPKQKTIDLSKEIFPKLKPIDQAMVIVHELLHATVFDHHRLTAIVTQLKSLVEAEIEQNQDKWKELNSEQIESARILTQLTLVSNALEDVSLSRFGGAIIGDGKFAQFMNMNKIGLSSHVYLASLRELAPALKQAHQSMEEYLHVSWFRDNSVINSKISFRPWHHPTIEELNKNFEISYYNGDKQKLLYAPKANCSKNIIRDSELILSHCDGSKNKISSSRITSELWLSGRDNTLAQVSTGLGGIYINGNSNFILQSELGETSLGNQNRIAYSDLQAASMVSKNYIFKTKISVSFRGPLANKVGMGISFLGLGNYSIGSSNHFSNVIMDATEMPVDASSVPVYRQLLNNSVIINSRVPLLTGTNGSSFRVENIAVASNATHMHNTTGQQVKLKGLRMVNNCSKYHDRQKLNPFTDAFENAEIMQLYLSTCGYQMNFEGKQLDYNFDPKTTYMFSKRAARGTSFFTRAFTNSYLQSDDFSGIEDFEKNANDVYRK